MGKVIVNSYQEFEQYAGKELGVSGYHRITQDQINRFADASLCVPAQDAVSLHSSPAVRDVSGISSCTPDHGFGVGVGVVVGIGVTVGLGVGVGGKSAQ